MCGARWRGSSRARLTAAGGRVFDGGIAWEGSGGGRCLGGIGREEASGMDLSELVCITMASNLEGGRGRDLLLVLMGGVLGVRT